MRILEYLFLVSIVGYSGLAFSQTNLTFLSKKDASIQLTVADDFLSQLSTFDTSARMKTERLVSKNNFAVFVSNSTVDWENSEISIVTQAFESINTQIENISM